jgi:hypothetical protein
VRMDGLLERCALKGAMSDGVGATCAPCQIVSTVDA